MQSSKKFWREIRGSNPDGSEWYSALQSLRSNGKEARLERKDPAFFAVAPVHRVDCILHTLCTAQECDIDGCFSVLCSLGEIRHWQQQGFCL